MDKVLFILTLASVVALVIIGFAVKPVVTGLIILAIVVVGWHDDYYLRRQ